MYIDYDEENEKGRLVRAKIDIPSGNFVCEYKLQGDIQGKLWLLPMQMKNDIDVQEGKKNES